MSKQFSGYSLDRDTGELRGPPQIGSGPLPKSLERPLSVNESLFGKRHDAPDKHDPPPSPGARMVTIKYLYGPHDGQTMERREDDVPEMTASATLCEDKGNGHIFYPLNNEYAIYFPDPDDPELMVFYGLEYREIDLYKGKDCIINREWRAIR